MCRIVTSVYPSDEDDVITSPYNSVLAMRELTEHADCVLPVENQVGDTAGLTWALTCSDSPVVTLTHLGPYSQSILSYR